MGTKIIVWIDGIKEAEGHFSDEAESRGAWSDIRAAYHLDIDTEYADEIPDDAETAEIHDVVNFRFKRRKVRVRNVPKEVLRQLQFCIRTMDENLSLADYLAEDELDDKRDTLVRLCDKMRRVLKDKGAADGER